MVFLVEFARNKLYEFLSRMPEVELPKTGRLLLLHIQEDDMNHISIWVNGREKVYLRVRSFEVEQFLKGELPSGLGAMERKGVKLLEELKKGVDKCAVLAYPGRRGVILDYLPKVRCQFNYCYWDLEE